MLTTNAEPGLTPAQEDEMEKLEETTREELLDATADDILRELLANVRPATPGELRVQRENFAKNYKPGPRQARAFRC